MKTDLSQTESITSKTLSSVGYNLFAKIITIFLRIGASIILARSLTASDYGVVGFAMVVIGFMTNLSDLGIGSAIVQRSVINQKVLNTAYSLRVVLGTLACATCIIMAPYAHKYFDHPEIGVVTQVLSINFLLSVFSFIPESIFRKEIEFKKISMANLFYAMVRAIVSITLVLNGFKYWSIVLGEIGANITRVVVLRKQFKNKMSFQFETKISLELISFGGKIFLSGVVIFAIFNADNFVIGTIAGASLLGYYALAFSWGTLSCTIISEGVHSVLFPAFSKMQDDKVKLRMAYLKVLEYVSMIGIMANIVLITNSRDILFFILGRGTDKWLSAEITLIILSIYGIIRILLEPIGNVVLALGKPGIILKANIIAGALEVGLLYIAVKYGGINGVATLVTFAYALQYIVFLPFLKRELMIGISDIIATIRPALICGGVVTVSTFLLGQELGFSITSMVIKFAYCIFSYLALYGVLTGWRIFKEVMGLLSSRATS